MRVVHHPVSHGGVANRPAPEQMLDIYRFFLKYKEENRGMSPTLDEIACALNYKNKGAVYPIILKMIGMGIFERRYRVARSLQLTEGGETRLPEV